MRRDEQKGQFAEIGANLRKSSVLEESMSAVEIRVFISANTMFIDMAKVHMGGAVIARRSKLKNACLGN